MSFVKDKDREGDKMSEECTRHIVKEFFVHVCTSNVWDVVLARAYLS